MKRFDGDKTDVTALVAYAQSLEADNERLRAALTAICNKYGDDIECSTFALNAIAESALNQQGRLDK